MGHKKDKKNRKRLIQTLRAKGVYCGATKKEMTEQGLAYARRENQAVARNIFRLLPR